MSKSNNSPATPSFYNAASGQWERLQATPDPVEDLVLGPATVSEQFRNLLLTSLQMNNLVVLAGSGTSLGHVGGPSMRDLWEACVLDDTSSGALLPAAQTAMNLIGYDPRVRGENIETLLSHCEAYQHLNPEDTVETYVRTAKRTILQKCSDFLRDDCEDRLTVHRTFLKRMSRRRARDPRLKIFTTNYDLCFETGATLQGLVAINGFSFTEPRYFDPRFFQFDIVRRLTISADPGAPLEGVFHLYKLHGSVNWSRRDDGHIEIVDRPPPANAVLIYPADGKYRESYIQPHLETMSQFLTALREPNTCVISIGFGFKDRHLSEPLLTAVGTNAHLRLVVVNPCAKEEAEEAADSVDPAWRAMFTAARRGEDVWLVNATFEDFAQTIPDLRALSAGERLRREIEDIARTGRDHVRS